MLKGIRFAGVTAVAVASAMVMAACSTGGSGGSAAAGSSGDAVGGVVRLATGVDPSYGPIYIAEDQGFFKKRGVNVDVSVLGGGPAMAQAVIAGQADMGTQSDATTVTQMANSTDLVGLVDFGHSTSFIKVVWGPKVKAPSDLKKLATLPGIMTLATVRYLESKHVDPKSVQEVSANAPDIPTMLQRGDVDGTVIYEPWATRAATESGGKIVANIGDFGVSYSQWLIASNKWLKGHETQAARVAAAINDANNFIKAHPAQADQIISKAISLPVDQTATLMKDLIIQTRDIDSSALATEKKTAQFFVDNGTLKSMPDLDKQVLVGWWSSHKQ